MAKTTLIFKLESRYRWIENKFTKRYSEEKSWLINVCSRILVLEAYKFFHILSMWRSSSMICLYRSRRKPKKHTTTNFTKDMNFWTLSNSRVLGKLRNHLQETYLKWHTQHRLSKIRLKMQIMWLTLLRLTPRAKLVENNRKEAWKGHNLDLDLDWI